MRIAYLTGHATSHSASGSAVHVSQVAYGLIQRGHVLYTNSRGESSRLVRLSPKDFVIRSREIDLFYIRIDGWPSKDKLTLLRKLNRRAPCIWEINAPIEEQRQFGASGIYIHRSNERRKKLSKMVNTAIAVSNEMGEYAKKKLEIQNTFIVPNGSDPEMFTPAKRNPTLYGKWNFKVIWCGSPQYPWQGLDIVEKLAWKLKEIDEDILVIVTADGRSSDNILYLGQVPYHAMPLYMASADVGLCIYNNIDFYKDFFFSPLKLYDYMASGLPVVGSDQGQIRFVLEECNSGLLVDTSVDTLVERILQLKGDPELAKLMGSNGRSAVINKYNWTNVVEKYESILVETAREYEASHGQSEKTTIHSGRIHWIVEGTQMAQLALLLLSGYAFIGKTLSKASRWLFNLLSSRAK